ncbi:MAG TPA: hypothetical protein VFZ16_04640 [Hyphomicrobiaceae bacterium]|nr:hypothetical protein [Hyphomicrobiaceae bacterium]
MAPTTSFAGWQRRPPLIMAVLGLIAGGLSAAIGFDLEPTWLKPVGKLFFMDAGPVPIGLFFGAAIGLGLWHWTRNWWALPVLAVTTMYAWSAALQLAIRLQRNVDDDPHLLAASLAAGAAGAGLTHLGCSLFAPELRRIPAVALTCIVGAAAGLLLFLGQRKIIDERLLFLIWQPAAAFAIGSGLGQERQQSPAN